MKFLCLGYFDKEKMDARPQSEIETVIQECRPHTEKLYESGQIIIDAGLDVVGKYLRRVNGKVVVTDGPFAETKEMVGGLFIIEAQDMEEAIRIASLHPTTQVPAGEHFGWHLEIRPIPYFEKFTSNV